TDDQLTDGALANAKAAVLAGITTVRDCGGRGRVVQLARDRIRRGEAQGADILACGAPITTTRGHCHWLGLIADGEAQAVAAAERMLREDADFLKVMATGGEMTPRFDPMKPPYDAGTLARAARPGQAAGQTPAPPATRPPAP